MEDVRIQGWYTSPPSSRTPYFMDKDVLDMTLIERMVDDGLEDYVIALETSHVEKP